METVTPQQRARRLIDENLHMTIATRDPAGAPWCRRVLYAPDEAYDLYWISAKSARHSQNIRSNPFVSIMIYEISQGHDAAYIAGRAVELDERREVERAAEIIRRRQPPGPSVIEDPSALLGEGSQRIYRASPRTIEVRREPAAGQSGAVEREPADFRWST